MKAEALEAQKHEQQWRVAKMRFINAALAAGWNWHRISEPFGQSATGVRRWHERNHRNVRVVD